MASKDEDQSLFGSPTPSRSPSPTLALPGAGDGLLPGAPNSIAQNVGTIALPGSQLCSELPKDPLASSLKYFTPRDARPDLTTAAPSPAASALLSGTSTPSSRSRSSSAVPSATKPKKRKRTRKEAQPSPPPLITLPDPSTSLPPNFLRSQKALLGTAGLVAGIKPANLGMQLGAFRGSTPTNPIVVDHDSIPGSMGRIVRAKASISSRVSSSVRYDEHDAPRLGKRFGSMTPSLNIDPVLLPAPTNKEIVAMLIGQKDIFPVLQNILRLIAGQKTEQIAAAATKAPPRSGSPLRKRKTKVSDAQSPRTPTPTSVGSKAPPLKRRKLNRVPAGAADWDVPYPFQEGEGPEEYRTTWEKERGKQLISQLVNLIRTAARKAATKKYLLQQGARLGTETRSGHVGQSQRSQSAPASFKEAGQLEAAKQLVSGALAPRPASQQPQPSASITTPSDTPPQSSPYAIPSESLPETSLDQLISSLLAASSTTDASIVQCDSAYGAGQNTLPDPSTTFVSAGSGEDVNDDLINSWINVFETFPIPSDGFASALDASPLQGPHSLNSASNLVPGPANFDFFDVTLFDFDIHTTHSQTTQGSNATTTVQLSQPPESMSQQDAEQFMRDFGLDIPASQTHSMRSQSPLDIMIDPTLPAISQPRPRSLVDMNKIDNFTCPSDQNPSPMEGISGAPSPPAPSPMPSASSVSSVGDGDPSTPTSALWESSTPDIALPQNSQDPSASQAGEHRRHEDDGVSETRGYTAQQKEKWKESVVKSRDDEQHAIMEAESGQAEREEQVSAPATSTSTPFHALTGLAPLPLDEPTRASTPSPLDPSTLRSTPPTVLSPSPPSTRSKQKKLSRQEIIRRAQERRKQLVEELEQVKVQLWEMTIEQSVLVELQKEVLL
ncbi:hypothetical protein AX15_001981 [Amanita polypyramis BW_CC]|nr:hypothetical protein AX15_001981 [Amanita polypyramis BW_CC]